MPQSQRNKGAAKDNKKKKDKEKLGSQKKKESKKRLSEKFIFLCFCFYQKIIHESLLYWSEQSERQYNIAIVSVS